MENLSEFDLRRAHRLITIESRQIAFSIAPHERQAMSKRKRQKREHWNPVNSQARVQLRRGLHYQPTLETIEARLLLTSTIMSIGTLGGNLSAAYGINASGEVTGSSTTYNGSPGYAFLYQNGVMTDLGSLTNGNGSGGYAISNTGNITGISYYDYVYLHAFLSQGSGMSDPNPPYTNRSEGYGVNDSGEIVGTANSSHAVLIQNDTLTDLNPKSDPSGQSQANAINDNGEIVGWYISSSGGGEHAVIFNNGQSVTYLGNPQGVSSEALGINAGGQIVGDSGGYAFLYNGGVTTNIGTLPGYISSQALGINSSDQVVGLAKDTNNNSHAFYYNNGTMIDLNSVLPVGSG